MRFHLSRVLVTACILGGVSLPAIARAEDKAVCLAAYEQTQTLRKDNKLIEAREKLLVCTKEGCPKLVRTDCAKWMDEVTASLPTLVFSATDAAGKDRTDFSVLIDGNAVSERLGQEVTVNPGPHKIRFEAPNADPVEQEIIVRAGEKSRAVAIKLAESVKKVEPPPPAPPKPVPVGPERRPMPILVPVLGGLGIAALGTGAVLGITAHSQLDDLRSTCAPHCEPSDVDALNLRYRIAAISVGVGAVAIGAAVYFFIKRPSVQSSTTTGFVPSEMRFRF